MVLFLWFSCGFTRFPRRMLGSPMVFLRSCMVFRRFSYGFNRLPRWLFDFSIVVRWRPYGFVWFSAGFRTGYNQLPRQIFGFPYCISLVPNAGDWLYSWLNQRKASDEPDLWFWRVCFRFSFSFNLPPRQIFGFPVLFAGSQKLWFCMIVFRISVWFWIGFLVGPSVFIRLSYGCVWDSIGFRNIV